MTPETMKALTGELLRQHHPCSCGDYCEWCAPWACGATSQQIMDAYLAPYASDRHYKMLRANAPEFLAVLATAEYHEHWHARRK